MALFGLLKSGFKKIQGAFAKTRSLLGERLQTLFKSPLNEERLEELEQILFEADLGSTLADAFVRRVRKSMREGSSPLEIMKKYALEIFQEPSKVRGKEAHAAPQVILVVGVNGSGKTTSCAKLARLYKEKGKRVLLAAADTFRAAAIEQLATWAERLDIACVKGNPGGDPSAVVFDALSAAQARGYDVVIADTAGRLQSKSDLMEELKKVNRVIQKQLPDAPHETYLVLDATMGQNALDQTQTFHRFTPLTGLILTKLDGSAKGGVLLPIYHQFGIPLSYIGVGEGVDDLLPFDPTAYVEALFS